jgi:hypothetical protein
MFSILLLLTACLPYYLAEHFHQLKSGGVRVCASCHCQWPSCSYVQVTGTWRLVALRDAVPKYESARSAADKILRGLRLLAIREEHRLSLLVFKIEIIRQYAERAMLSGAQPRDPRLARTVDVQEYGVKCRSLYE